MPRLRAMLLTAALIAVPPSLFAQATLTRGGGTIGVLGPASAFASAPGTTVATTGARGSGHAAVGRAMASYAAAPRRAGGGCRIYGFLGGLSGSSTLNSIGVFDLTGQASGNFSLGTISTPANAAGGVLSANLGAAPTGNVATSVPRNAGRLFQYATDVNCNQGASFTTKLTSNPAGSGSTIVATANTLRMDATYSTTYFADPNNPYYCYYTNRPGHLFLCNVWSANVSFSFLSSTFAAQGAGNYTLNIVRATLTSP